MKLGSLTVKLLFFLLAVVAFAQAPKLTERDVRVQPKPDKNERQKLERKPSPVIVPRGFALIVGIAHYEKVPAEYDTLKFTEHDAELMQRVLTSKTGGNFAPENVRTLIGPKATREEFRKAVEEWLPSVARPEDRVVIYFAGHGVAGEGGKGYLALYDVDVERLDETGYPMEKLGAVVRDRIKAQWKVLLTDACHSGLVSSDLGLVNEALSNVKGILTLTASKTNESAFEDPDLKQGIFTYFVARALEGNADRNGDGLVTADEFVDYVRNNVVERALKAREHQTPRENQDFSADLILGFNPEHVSPQKTYADGGLIVESNMDEVEFLLDDVSKGTVSKKAPLQLPGIKAGIHMVKAVKQGYDPDGPREVMVEPGVDTPVHVRIQFARKRDKSAVKFFDQGREKYLHAKSEPDCREAVELFKKALAADPHYSEAAMYLGRTYRLLDGREGEAVQYQKKAIDLDPDYLEARISYGVLLTDLGNTDEAIQQLRQALERDPGSAEVHAHLAHAYRLAENYVKAAEEAREALRLNPDNAQAHLWLGDCLRQMNDFEAAAREYNSYVRLTNFDPNMYYKTLGYLTVPFISFYTKNASHKIAYKDQRNQGYFGLCACEHLLKEYNVAIQSCKKALAYDPKDPYSYYILGRIYIDKYNVTSRRDALLVARENFNTVVKLNPDLEQARYSRQYLEQIDSNLKQLAER
jgi:tetratricopeptide (TPR) repeat protein